MSKIYNTTKFGEDAGSSDGFGNWGYQGSRHGETRWKVKWDGVLAKIDVCTLPGEGQLCACTTVHALTMQHFSSPGTTGFSTIHEGFAQGRGTYNIWYFVMWRRDGPHNAARWPQPQPQFPPSSTKMGGTNIGHVVVALIVGVWWDPWTLSKLCF